MALLTIDNVRLALLAEGEPDPAELFVGTLSLSAATPASPDYLDLALTLPGDPAPVFSMPFLVDSHQSSSSSSYLVPNLTGTDPRSSTALGRANGSIQLSLPPTVPSEDRETFEAVLETGSRDGARTTFFDAPAVLARNQLYVVDESTGTVLGQLDQGAAASSSSTSAAMAPSALEEDSSVSSGHMRDDDPSEAVVINSLEPSGPTWNAASASRKFSVKPLSAYYHPAPNPDKSAIISVANLISHGLVIGSTLVATGLEKSAGYYLATRPATESPLMFTDATKHRWDQSTRYTGKAVVYSGKATGYVGKWATEVGDRLGKATGIQSAPGGPPPGGLKGLVAKSLVAINTIGDHLDASGKSLLESGTKSASEVVHHRYGPEARGIADDAGKSVKHCALVYIDARGVTRRALIKAVGKGALKAKMADGSQLYLTDSSDTSEYELQRIEQAATSGASTNPFDRDTKVPMLPYRAAGGGGGGGAAPPSYATTVDSDGHSAAPAASGTSTPTSSLHGVSGAYPSSTYKTYNDSKKDQ
ncbi:hypothetical protein JCM11491_002742 [Sporobolomyces phaffii]